ncbi:MAG: PilZ domain-containing protein, partial [Methyloprofundus sp.]|nr:PilZ domain-containing protein [Methyloprofundus sp.]
MSESSFSLASWKNPSKDDNQRHNERTAVSGWDATLFTEGVIALSSEVEDSSASGAGLMMPNAVMPIDKDVELTLTINTGHKQFTRKAIVRWVDTSRGEVRFGVQYLDHAGLTPETHELDISAVRIDPACALRIPTGIAVRRKILPFLEMNGVVHVACADIKNVTVLNSVGRMLKAPICIWPVDAKALDKVLKEVYGNEAIKPVALPGAKKPKEEDKSNQAVDLAEDLLYSAFVRQASDIHVDPHHKGARIRFRVDGQLEVYQEIKADIYV